MFWFNRQNPQVVFADIRSGSFVLNDKSTKGGNRELHIKPDVVADFTALPFADNSFKLVVFDPPHFRRNGEKGWVALKYGTLKGDWQTMLRKGFEECFRVLKRDGILIFKWNECDVPVSKILALTVRQPLFGNRCGKSAKTHWIVFMKEKA